MSQGILSSSSLDRILWLHEQKGMESVTVYLSSTWGLSTSLTSHNTVHNLKHTCHLKHWMQDDKRYPKMPKADVLWTTVTKGQTVGLSCGDVTTGYKCLTLKGWLVAVFCKQEKMSQEQIKGIPMILIWEDLSDCFASHTCVFLKVAMWK